MTIRTRLLRLLAGGAIIVALLGIAFPLLPHWFHTWGATEAEVNADYPGDELITEPLIFWMHATTIDAPPEEVWPWIAQLGDRRGGFYSYTLHGHGRRRSLPVAATLAVGARRGDRGSAELGAFPLCATAPLDALAFRCRLVGRAVASLPGQFVTKREATSWADRNG